MKLSIPSARVLCPCIDCNDSRSLNDIDAMRFCEKCEVKRCMTCTLHSPISRSCSRCKREYGLEETHCLRCYECPRCFNDLSTYPVPYMEENGQLKVAREKGAKIVGKAVFFKCIRKSCGYKFTTAVETRPQTLQEIVQGSVKDGDEVRYAELQEYYEWCINYHRILDRRQRLKWKTEIMKRFESLEVAKILKEDDNLLVLANKEESLIRRGGALKREVPLAKRLGSQMKDICTTCLHEVVGLTQLVPVLYSVVMHGSEYLILVNTSDRVLCVTMLEESHQFELEPSGDTIESVPTCLLGYIEGEEEEEEEEEKGEGEAHAQGWKGEVENRDVSVFNKDPGVIDRGKGWVTIYTGESRRGEGRTEILVNHCIRVEYIIGDRAQAR